MKVFISWSGDLSHAIAKTLHEWLPSVIQALRPFLSSEDISSGDRWEHVLNSELEETSFGIVCLTKENRQCHPWIMFEAGAIARVVNQNRLAVLLIDIPTSDVLPPLKSFQSTPARDRNRMEKLVMDLNIHAGLPVTDAKLKTQFTKYWPDFERALAMALKSQAPAAAKAALTPRTGLEVALDDMLSMQKELRGMMRSMMAVQATAVADSSSVPVDELPPRRRLPSDGLKRPMNSIIVACATPTQLAEFIDWLTEKGGLRADVHPLDERGRGPVIHWNSGPRTDEAYKEARRRGLTAD